MQQLLKLNAMSIAVVAAVTSNAYGYEFTTSISDLRGSLVSNVTAGMGIRTQNPSCSLTGNPYVSGCGAGANIDQWPGSDGDLNYHKGQPYSAYLSLTSELLLLMPSEGLKFMARGTGMYDFAAGHTDLTPLSSTAAAQVVYNAQLLDLWVEKDFTVDGRSAHVRVGNQVINWGESIYASGGINSTNSLDTQKLLIPGAQLKQALLPAPMVSVASDLPFGMSTEAYYQLQWNGNRYPPVGSYWSTSNSFGRGTGPATTNANNYNVGGPSASTIATATGGVGAANNLDTLAGINSGLLSGAYAGAPFYSVGSGVSWQPPTKYKPQFGIKFSRASETLGANFSFYYENYTDKSPVITATAAGITQYSYLENRQLFGVSTNFGIGDWAISSELSYRPHDAVALSSCYGAGGPLDLNTNGVSGSNCQQWIDSKKVQFDINGLLALPSNDYPFIKLIGADSANLTWELTWIYYPGLNTNGYTKTINGQQVTQVPLAGYMPWLNYNSGLGYPIGSERGTASSVGATIDFNWTYDSTLIRGWQVTPGMTFTDALYGYTPTFTMNYSQGAKSLNLYVLFNQNPTVWQAGINYAMYFGGHGTVGNSYADRNFVGLFATRNF
ncbi:DUF1302 domain-containing protein (plasmid) [Paraburkholderia sprentiae WSM5005]|uniref:DUF1302 domain-containing protein n=1 Tax=Paraburkholderia sprentiae WSM5005 TaxID=754502 RepID=A0A1I9YW82_9BURK|nr:DUF1302 family protein [Paraburkholderia sprentiae]APA90488.1 DUF1302 domain-containing protein [Paraburkholderia sprentiae WSM5005]